MIAKDAAVNGKFYLCPVYNEMVLKQKKIGVYEIDRKDYFLFKTREGINSYQKYLMKMEGEM